MIDPLDVLLRDLLQTRVPGFIGGTQVGFAAPNADWKSAVVAAGEERFNLFLYDLRENTRLRTNERETIHDAGTTRVNRASPRLDCTYLVTAWSPVAVTPFLDASREEHQLLYRALAVLMRFRPLVAADVYARPAPSGVTLAAFTALAPPLVEQPLPLQVSPPDATRPPSEFWTTMKVESRPAIHLTVTIPVVLDEPDVEYPAVTSLTTRFQTPGPAGLSETVLAVGGRVLRTTDESPVDGAWVQIVGKAPPAVAAVRQRVVTGADGRFIFTRLPRGTYELRAVASGLGDRTSPPFDVPLETGTCDVHLP